MNLTNINVYAEAYYSGNTHEENFIITTETYEKMKDAIDNLKFYFSELDGKHSEVKAETTITHYLEEEILNMTWDDIVCDGDSLSERLAEVFEEYELILDDEEKLVNNYLNSIDTYVDITVRVKKSNKDKVVEFCKEL